MKHPQSVNKSILIREVYEDTFQKEQRLKWEEAWMEAQTKRLRKLND